LIQASSLSILVAMDKDKLLVGSDEVHLRVTSAALLALEVRMPPGGGPPGLHRHDPDEIYRIERGTLTLYLDRDGVLERRAAGPGDVVHIPGGLPHTVRNESGEEATAYVVFAPGAPMERFIRAAAALEPGGDVAALAERHGIRMSG
jgi:mannose-6-phosphate isomerase-like protein (cupin superfamily)